MTLLSVEINTDDLVRFVRWFDKLPDMSADTIADGLNEFGHGLGREIRQNMSNSFGLSTDVMERYMIISDASKNHLECDISVNTGGISEELSSSEMAIESRRDWQGRLGEVGQEQLVAVVGNGGYGDDGKICEICQEIIANNPYTLQEAMSNTHHGGTIGKNRCRCIVIPWMSAKRLPVTYTQLVGGQRQEQILSVSIQTLGKNLADNIGEQVKQHWEDGFAKP